MCLLQERSELLSTIITLRARLPQSVLRLFFRQRGSQEFQTMQRQVLKTERNLAQLDYNQLRQRLEGQASMKLGKATGNAHPNRRCQQ